jgi:hypothetical protein
MEGIWRGAFFEARGGVQSDLDRAVPGRPVGGICRLPSAAAFLRRRYRPGTNHPFLFRYSLLIPR